MSSPARQPNSRRDELSPPPGCIAVLVLVFVALSLYAYYQLGAIAAAEISWNAEWTSFKFGLATIPLCCAAVWITRMAARLTRRKRAVAFISYPREEQATASTIASRIAADDVVTKMIPFVDRPDAHNEVIGEVVENIRLADVLIVVTASGSNTASVGIPRFYEAEILAATTASKPVILLGRASEFRLPPTAYLGYPVLDLQGLDRSGYDPLRRLVHYAVGTKRTVSYAYSAAWDKTFWTGFALAMIMSAAWWIILPIFAAVIVGLLTFAHGVAGIVEGLAALRNTTSMLFMGVSELATLGVFFSTLRRQFRFQKTLTQDFAHRRVRNADLSALLKELEDGSNIVKCLLDPETARTSTASTSPTATSGTLRDIHLENKPLQP